MYTGTHRRATGKRTPRVPVLTSRDDGEGSTPPNKRARKRFDANDDVELYLELALAEASSRRGGGSSRKVSESPDRIEELSDNSPIKNWGKMVNSRALDILSSYPFIYFLRNLDLLKKKTLLNFVH